MKCYKTYVGQFLIKNQVLVPKCLSIFCTGAEVFLRHFGTSAEMSWVRSVCTPKCLYSRSLEG